MANSRINKWFITAEGKELEFFNIFSQKRINADLKVVGYLDDIKEIVVDNNYVIRVTYEGVMTHTGTVYRFDDAHPIYLNFLIKANNEKLPVIAWNWKEGTGKERLTADINQNGEVKTNVEFDFEPDDASTIVFSGYSRMFGADVLVSTFCRKGATIAKLPNEVLADIYTTAKELEDTVGENIRKVRKILEETAGIQFSEIYVMRSK